MVDFAKKLQNEITKEVNAMYPYQYMQSQQIIRVNGENGAKAYSMAPNSSILLLDETAPVVWLKQTDGAGYPSLTPYEIKPYTPTPPPDMNDVLARIKRLEDRINEQSNTTNVNE